MSKTKSEYCKEWYQLNKAKHNAYCATKVTCSCGRIIARASMSNHMKTKTHEKLLTEVINYEEKYKKLQNKYKQKIKLIEKLTEE